VSGRGKSAVAVKLERREVVAEKLASWLAEINFGEALFSCK
jgi:hypothetical protein